MKYIILNKLIYGLESDIYLELSKLEISYRHAEKKASDNDEPMLAYDEYNDLNNFLTWIRDNVKPISSERDNFDLHRYDAREQKNNDENLPF